MAYMPQERNRTVGGYAEGGRMKPLHGSTPADGFVRTTETIVEYVRMPIESPLHERPLQVDEFITKVQTESSRSHKDGPIRNLYWWQKPNYNSHGGGNNYGRASDHGTNIYNKPYGTDLRQANFDGGFGKTEVVPNTKHNHTMISTDSQFGPNQPSKEAPSKLLRPTQDIETADDYAIAGRAPPTTLSKVGVNPQAIDSREAVQKFGSLTTPPAEIYTQTQGRVSLPVLSRVEVYPQAIDSKEAVRKFGGLTTLPAEIYTQTQGRVSPPVLSIVEVYPQAIDSKEAARRYGGLATSHAEMHTPTIDSKEAAWKYRGEQL